jgi:hypothetical protein
MIISPPIGGGFGRSQIFFFWFLSFSFSFLKKKYLFIFFKKNNKINYMTLRRGEINFVARFN